MNGVGISDEVLRRRYRALDYLVVAQLFLQDNFLLKNDLTSKDIKPRLLGHWGTCHGINVVYSNLKAFFDPGHFGGLANAQAPSSPTALENSPATKAPAASASHAHAFSENLSTSQSPAASNFTFLLGPGHGFPALQANLFLDGDLERVDPQATRNLAGLAYLCKNFSWPGGFPSHASPLTPGVICEGGELGYALATAYGAALGHPEKTVAVLIGDGEFETATALASMNLVKLLGEPETGKSPNGRVVPILHLNGYKISAPTVAARKSPRELSELIRGFGFTPIEISGDAPDDFQAALAKAYPLQQRTAVSSAPIVGSSSRGENYATALYQHAFQKSSVKNPFFIFRSTKGATGPSLVHGQKIADNFLAHQIPLKEPRVNAEELQILDSWLRSYRFAELFDAEKGFTL